MSELAIVERAAEYADRTAIGTPAQTYSYGDIVRRSAEIASALLDGRSDLAEARVAFLIPAGFDYVAAQWGVWRAGGVATPLSLAAAKREWEYALTDAEVTAVIASDAMREQIGGLAARLGLRLLAASDAHGSDALPVVDADRRAMILYTSGTTSKPKGVVTTHACIQSQIESLVDAWRWRADDRIPLFLPLHHIHGIINVMSCALWSGATFEPFARFDIQRVLQRVAEDAYTVFMAVPTIYVKLIDAIETMESTDREAVVEAFGRMRLMVSGSAALPASVHEQWTALTGQKLLERYGMTEVGMAISNPYEGERRPGAVGQPLPGVQIRLCAEQGDMITDEDSSGEIQVRGPNVFCEYWNRPEATAESFTDGWFRTGDMAVLESGYYRIMGRQSVDIIKSGGYKLSALEIEAALLDHPNIAQCAVVGLPDATWGEIVAAAVVLKKEPLELDDLQTWCADRISSYKVPRRLLTCEALPRNAMGKVTKPAVVEMFT